MSGLPKRVLIVDDAALMRVYYRSILEGAGFRVEEALNGLEALETLLARPVDLLVVDINMPQMDGLTFLRTLREKAGPIASIPALVTSTESAASRFRGRARRRRQLLSGEARRARAAGGIRAAALRGSVVNEFLQQFVIESRELADAASRGWALEQSPRMPERSMRFSALCTP